MNIEPAYQTFIAESKDLVADMEEALLKLEKTPGDDVSITAVFRCAHTIKGSAGVFGFSDIVAFTHVMESLLDDIRLHRTDVDADIIALLLQCGDHILILLDAVANKEQFMSADIQVAHTALIERLKLYLDESVIAALETDEDQSVESQYDDQDTNVVSEAWHISVRFGRDVLRNGMDPLSILRYMETLGDIINIATLSDAIPEPDEMDPETCYMGLEMDFYTSADKKSIEAVFDFVRDDCDIRILPPHSKVSEYIKLIEELPEDKKRIGELLVECGSITENELDHGLSLQNKTVKEEGLARTKPRIGEILVDNGVVQSELVDAALVKQTTIQQNLGASEGLMRVHAGKLDELITQVGELVIAASGARLLSQNSGNSELTEISLNVENLVEQVRESALKLRMVPIGETFSRFNRVVRDISRDLNKKVELVVSGSETELDKSMVDKISDPLMHLVRNALDHGIESIEKRIDCGKPEIGKVILNAYHDSGSIVIEVEDDGAGLDKQKILSKAIDKGIISADEDLTDQEIYMLVAEAGFSTADAVTNVSGRGVGMDVVKRNVESMRGNLSIDSISGERTIFTLRLPLTLAIIDGFLMGVGKSSYVAPLDMVVECLELSSADRKQIKTHSYINLRDEVLPLLRLRSVFDVHEEESRRENIVVIEYAGQRVGLIVDVLQGEIQTVIKPLGRLFERLSGISGSTVLGNGNVALILDVPTLVKQVIDRDLKKDRNKKEAHKIH